MKKISGKPLCGFASMFEEPRALIGVYNPKKPTVVVKVVSKGNVPVKTGAYSKKMSPHLASLTSATNAGGVAGAAAKKGLKSVAAFNPKKHLPLVPIAKKVGVHGEVIIGLVPTKPLTQKQGKAVAKHTKAIANHAKAVVRLKKVSEHAAKVGSGAQSFSAKAAPGVKNTLAGKKVSLVSMHGDFGVYGEGDEQEPEYDPNADPNAPLPDPEAGGETQSGVVLAPDGSVLYDPATDPAVVPTPQRGGSLSKADAGVTWQNVPADGIAYGGEKGIPAGAFASYSIDYGDHYGLFWSERGWKERNAGGDNLVPDGTDVAAHSANIGWGPLIGRPNLPQGVDPAFSSLQWATKDSKWFWQGKNAPAWATAELDAKLAEANRKTIESHSAAAQVVAAQMAKDAADRAEAQAKQEAANALAQSAADTAANIEAQKQESQRGALDVQQQQIDQKTTYEQAAADREAQRAEQQNAIEQAKADRAEQIEQAKVDREAQAAQNALDAQERRQELEYAKNHPKAYSTPSEAPQGGGGGYAPAPQYSDEGGGGESDSAAEAADIDAVEGAGAGKDNAGDFFANLATGGQYAAFQMIREDKRREAAGGAAVSTSFDVKKMPIYQEAIKRGATAEQARAASIQQLKSITDAPSHVAPPVAVPNFSMAALNLDSLNGEEDAGIIGADGVSIGVDQWGNVVE